MFLAWRPTPGDMFFIKLSARAAAVLGAALALTLMSIGPASADATLGGLKPVFPPQPLPDRYIVVYDRGVDVDAETDRHERAQRFRARFRYRHALQGFAAKLSPGQLRQVRQDPDVAYVTPDRRVHAVGTVPLADGEPTPPPGVRRIQAATTTTAREAADVGVAVIDTGIDLDHPDLNAAAGTNCITPGTAPDDDNGHGTHVAGSIAAGNQGAGVVGVAPATPLYAVKVLAANGSGSDSSVICGIDWVTANTGTRSIKVANMSLGGAGVNDYACGSTNGDALHQAVCRSTQAGVLHVVAAGNDGREFDDATYPDTPAAYPEALTVTAMGDNDGTGGGLGGKFSCSDNDADDRYASFSNYALTQLGSAHTIAAPGVCIRSTFRDGGYATSSGTSMASPHVAGVASLCIGEAGEPGPCAGMTPAQIITHLRSDAATYTNGDSSYGFTGDPSGPRTDGQYYGYLIRTPRDTSPPDTSITSGPSGTTNDSTSTFAFTSNDSGASFDCRVDEGAWQGCSSPHTTSVLADGSHSFEVRAKDPAGNVDASPASQSFTIDTTTTTSHPGPAPAPQPDAAPANDQPSSPPVGEPAKLAVDRALVRRGRLVIAGRITRHATGKVRVVFRAARRTTRWRARIDSDRGRFSLRRRLSRRQVRLGTGIVVVRYRGNERTRPQSIRLRAAARRPAMKAGRPGLVDGRLSVGGSIARRARGRVRILLGFVDGGQERTVGARARIRRGRWQLSGLEVPAAARAGGQLTVLYPGHRTRRISGQALSRSVSGQ